MVRVVGTMTQKRHTIGNDRVNGSVTYEKRKRKGKGGRRAEKPTRVSRGVGYVKGAEVRVGSRNPSMREQRGKQCREEGMGK